MRDIELVPWNLAQIRAPRRVRRISRTCSKQQLHGRVPLAPRPIDQAPLRVLESANMPAVLIEMGYLTNPEQETALAGAEFQNAFVQARARRHHAGSATRSPRRRRPARSDDATARRVRLGVLAVVAVAIGWLLFVGLPRWYGAPAAPRRPPPPPAPPAPRTAGRSRRGCSTSPTTARG